MNNSKKRRFWVVIIIAMLVALAGMVSQRSKSAGALLGDEHANDVTSEGPHTIEVIGRFVEQYMLRTHAGRYYLTLFMNHTDDFLDLEASNQSVHLLRLLESAEAFTPGLEAMLDGKGDTVQITKEQVDNLKTQVDWVASAANPSLRDDIEKELQRFPLENFIGMTMDDAWEYVNDNFPPDLSLSFQCRRQRWLQKLQMPLQNV